MARADRHQIGRIPSDIRPSPILSPAARAAIVLVGTAGLVALAVAIVGPKRIHRGVLEPLHDALEPHAEKVWAGAHSLRDQIATVFENSSPEGRKTLAHLFQSWLGHFSAD